MQEIPTVDGVHYVSLGQFAISIVILVMLTIVIGYRNRATKPRYWALSAIEVVIFSYVWLFLALMTHAAIFTYFYLPGESELIVIDIINILSYIGFCVLLIIIEMHRGPPRIKSKETPLVNE